jgi:hypothetical protein
MIFQLYDLSIEFQSVDQILDNPNLLPIELKVTCTETGYTTLLIQAQETDEPVERRYKRRFRRFLLLGGFNRELADLLSSKKNRLIKRHDFFTEQGAIIVIDYETKPEE